MITHDLAISAVPYDAMLVAELSALLASRLHTPPFWRDASVPLESSRIALILHQRLWQHEDTTRLESSALQERVSERPDSVRVMTVDDAPLPDWLQAIARCDLAAVGLAGATEFVLDAITSSGGSLKHPAPPAPDAVRNWPSPPPYLAQPRAISSLRRELDALAIELAPPERAKHRNGDPPSDRLVELEVLHQRLIARVRDVALTFSWVGGNSSTVDSGRLLVIQWSGVDARKRGMAALTSAVPMLERVYQAEAKGPDQWCWRADTPNGRACSTAHLAAEWLAGASMSAGV